MIKLRNKRVAARQKQPNKKGKGKNTQSKKKSLFKENRRRFYLVESIKQCYTCYYAGTLGVTDGVRTGPPQKPKQSKMKKLHSSLWYGKESQSTKTWPVKFDAPFHG
jgi:hypothetical protein